jgi:serine/threonine-protein kinase
METAANSSILGSVVGSYRVRSQLGAGGAGNVYLAEHVVIKTRVAMKVLLPELAVHPCMNERFLDEARATAELDSPHLPRYYDFGHLPGGEPYAVMELLEGQTLADRLDEEHTLPVVTVVAIAQQIAAALGVAHAAGIVHRDIKPENVFLTQEASGGPLPFVKVLDFGIAKRLAGKAVVTTAQGIFVGSPAYCAPEQAMAVDLDGRADIYALGVTMFVCLTGRLPFDGEVTPLLFAKVREDAPSIRSLRPDLPGALATLIDQMLARDPARRPSTVQVVETRLAALSDELCGTVTMTIMIKCRPLTMPPLLDSPRWRRSLAVSAFVVIVALMIGLGAAGRKGHASEAHAAPPVPPVVPTVALMPAADVAVAMPEPRFAPEPVPLTPRDTAAASAAPERVQPAHHHRHHHRQRVLARSDVFIVDPFAADGAR